MRGWGGVKGVGRLGSRKQEGQKKAAATPPAAYARGITPSLADNDALRYLCPNAIWAGFLMIKLYVRPT